MIFLIYVICVSLLSHFSCVQLFAILCTVACQATYPPQGIFSTHGLNLHLMSPERYEAGSLPLVPPGKSIYAISSVQFSHSVMSNSLRPHGLQHARPPCPSPTPGVY